MRMTTPNLLSSEDAAVGEAIDWAAALAEHGRWLRTVVFARLGEPQAVDEVLQEVSLAAVEQRWPLADRSKLAGWLYRLAVHKALLYRRQRGRQQKLVDRYARRQAVQHDDRSAPDPLGWLLRDERQRLVLRALEGLPRRDREIFLLKYTENWSCRALAEHLGTTPSAVEARLHRVRQRLRSALVQL
jgi:RNA polymerase sigma factor (sigma-70 family)